MELVRNCGIPPRTPILFYFIPVTNVLTRIQFTSTPLSAKFQNHSNSIPMPWHALTQVVIDRNPSYNIQRCSYYHVFSSVVVFISLCAESGASRTSINTSDGNGCHHSVCAFTVWVFHHRVAANSLSLSQYGTMLHGTNVSKVTVSFVYISYVTCRQLSLGWQQWVLCISGVARIWRVVGPTSVGGSSRGNSETIGTSSCIEI